MESRAINSILSDELEKIKTTNKIIEIKLDDGEMFRISFDDNFWTITHALPSTRRYFSDTHADNKGVILTLISSYKVKSINILNGPELYSKAKMFKRLKELRFGKKKIYSFDSDIKFLKSL